MAGWGVFLGWIWNDEPMANVNKKGYVDAGWPSDIPEGQHAVTELVAFSAGALSPYGDLEFPLDPSTLSYVHPHTVINR
ncbi:hypothetical protein CAURIC_02565 [Corynebacterium auriscanis]|nr:hypothetical protein CAURIC_02565 [Corynebacterium auriscanis]